MEAQWRFAGEHADRDAICRISAGQGGTEACDWVGMLFRMYRQWAPRCGLGLETLAATDAPAGGYSGVEFVVDGRNAYGWMRSEHGVHRLARQSPHSAQSKLHTSFASVEVVPAGRDDPSGSVPPIDRSEVRIDTYRGSGPGGQHRNTRDTAVRATHIPTGITARSTRERSQHRNRRTALAVLAARVQAAETQTAAPPRPVPAAFGRQIRSYTLHPYRLVKDHRTKHQTPDTAGVLDGDIDAFMQAWQDHTQAMNPFPRYD